MRILYLHQYFNTPQMVGATRSYEMARRLAAWGHEVQMITSQRTPHNNAKSWFVTNESDICVHWLPVPYANAMSYQARIQAFLKFALGAARKAAFLQADVIFASSTPLTIALPAVYAARRQNIPMVFEVRDLWPEIPIAVGALRGAPIIWSARWLERWAYFHSAQIVALSPEMKSGVVKTGYPNEKVHVIPNSADLEFFNVSPIVGQEFRRRYEWLQNRPLVVYTGTLGKINGVDYLARLAAVVRSLMPEARFLTVGGGKEKEKVRQTAQELNVLGHNFFMLDALPKNEIPAVLAAADIATSTVIDLQALWANSANKFFDALASGTPIAINYGGWQAELLEQTGAGLVLDALNVERAASTLVCALQDASWRVYAGKAARALAEERFSRDKLAQQLESVLWQAVGR